MTFTSTRAPDGPRFSLAEALRLGPAPDGGLFMPASVEPLGDDFFDGLPRRSLVEIAVAVLDHLLPGELEPAALGDLAAGALDFDIPRVEVAPGLFVLELFHGPTLAFKDVGARFLARLLALTQPAGRRATVLVATSGDTGGAVAQAFLGVDGVDVAILYPDGKVSPLQERQFTTLGGNIRAFAVDGVFDDCQRLVNEAFADRTLATELGLTSANSINVGRLLPQSIYYFHAAAQAFAAGHDPAQPLLFSTPSGNFGNLTAGLVARRLGLDARFIAATNANDVVPQYLDTGRFEPRPSQRTLSNAMDVGHPNNFERILHLYGGDWAAIARDVSGFRVDDGATRETIRRVVDSYGYLLDPHTAVGWLAAE
ncbi:MAG: threonine synthase, partial [Acidobacteriota bacterium]